MGWFFGCFGGSSKKDRKHQAPVSPLPKQQKPLPLHAPISSSSAIPIKAFAARDGPNREDLFTVRQVSSSAPVRHTQGAYFHGEAGVRLPEKDQKPGPWHQLDDLEEELNDLRKQIERELHDAEKIGEETPGQLHYLKSCGSLVKSPTELKTSQQEDHQQSSVQEGRWPSWRAAAPSVARTPPEKTFQFEGLKVALCEPTPVKEIHGSLHGVQTRIQTKNVRKSTMQHKKQVDVQEDGFEANNNFDVGNSPISPAKFQEKDQTLPSPSHFDSETKCTPGVSDTSLERPCDNPNQTSWFLGGRESTLWTDAVENESASIKKRRLAVNVNYGQSPHVIQQTEDNVRCGQYHNLLSQKRLKIASSKEQVQGEMKSSLLHADPVPMHFFRCDSLSPIIEFSTSNEDSASSDTEGIGEGPFDQQQSSYSSAFQRITQSPSSRQSPASHGKSVTVGAINDEGYTTDELSYSHAAKNSEESYTNSTCVNVANEDDLETVSYSPSTDSEETLSDLSPEHCYSPPVSPSQERKSTVYRKCYSSGSTIERQSSRDNCTHSSVNGGKKKQHVLRYGSEEDVRSEDENELFTDAMSHVSTEYSEREYKKWHSRTESMDSVSVQMNHATDTIDTPPKQSDWIPTPNINIQGKHTSRIRSKPASAVLTPVENVSQWKQLKERDQKQIVDGKVGSDGSRRFCTSKKVEDICGTATENVEAEVGDENKILSWIPSRKDNGQLKSQNNVPVYVNTSLSHWAAASGSETVCLNVNASLSHWGVTSRVDAIKVDGRISEPEPVRVDMSLSHWLKSSSKHNEAQMSIGTSSNNSSSSGEGGVISPAPQPERQSAHIANKIERRQPFMYAASERLILGALEGENCENIKPRAPWDGKGTPNATAKYMEDQRVKWHSTPFEQRLEKALDKQGILLQKKLFTATPAAY